MVSQFLTNINKSTTRLDKLTQQLSSGQKIDRPSDDPGALAQIMTYQKSLKEIEQYGENINMAKGWLNATDIAYGQMTDIVQRINELALSAANGVWAPSEREFMAAEVDQLIQEFGQVANTEFNGKYIFGLTDYNVKPFADDFTASSPANNLAWEIEIGPNVNIELQNDAEDLFLAVAPQRELFQKLTDLSASIRSGSSAGLQQGLADIEDARTSVLDARAKVGVKSNRLDMLEARYSEEKLNLTSMLSEVGDTDVAEAMMQYKIQETVYESALSAGARIMQIRLLDYLR